MEAWRTPGGSRSDPAGGRRVRILEDQRTEHAQVIEALERSLRSKFHGYFPNQLSATELWLVARKPEPEAAAVRPEPSTPI